MPPHSPNMYRDPSYSASSPEQQLVGSPSLYRNVNAPAISPGSPAWGQGSPRFQAPPGSPASGQFAYSPAAAVGSGQFKGSPQLRGSPVIPQSLQFVHSSPQVRYE